MPIPVPNPLSTPNLAATERWLSYLKISQITENYEVILQNMSNNVLYRLNILYNTENILYNTNFSGYN